MQILKDKAIIFSPKNEQIKNLVKLRHQNKRRRQGLFFVEGFKEIQEALWAKVSVKTLYVCPELFTQGRTREFEEFLQRVAPKGIELQQVTAEVFEKISHREGPDGLFALCEVFVRELSELQLGENPLLAVVESVEKPGNLGGLIRSAEGVGVDALIVTEPCVDIFNHNVIRASLGMVFRIPIFTCDNPTLRAFLKERGICPVVATPEAETLYWEAPLQRGVAIVVGNEFYGVSPFWRKDPEAVCVRIPQHGVGDSLNVSVAGTLVLFEALRQRSGSQ